MLWSSIIDVLRGGLFVLSGAFGGSFGAAILVASSVVRIALLPVTIAATRRRLVREGVMRRLAPELNAIKTRYADQPVVAFEKTRALQAAHGIAMLDPKDLLGSLVQFPPAAALYAAIRGSVAAGSSATFLWVRSLAAPDRGLALVAAVVSGLFAWAGVQAIPNASAASHLVPVALSAVVTFLVLSHLGAGLALYSVANSLINGVERMIVARTLKPVRA
ncbi:MAG: YidC/Oxa1 family membrane protein insertase [Gemmatimonadaceae bacterium]